MVIIGVVLIAVAVAAAPVLITQNTGQMQIHALGHAWTVSAYWLLVAGLVILAVAVIGLAAIRHSGTRRLRRERVDLAAEKLVDQFGLTSYEAQPEDTMAPPARPQHLFHRHRPAV
jgi:chromate transport protein ChrA